ncbi:hypothetical protein DVH24_021066 [Malus domestica]|uniref:Leucine-rich repeat-containing N-terminal plant-type domain-containing protein n=1 Tax=Malus domestica TaxID=3750 RepID=A0A498JDY9_MALDO|nr:hypothetical protein DVH24_021066 [Malus domestica]
METLVLSENNFHVEISSSIGNLTALVNLDTSDNQLDGKIPSDYTSASELEILMSEPSSAYSKEFHSDPNKETLIPTWIGKSLPNLGVLSLRLNMLHGNIPHELCSLRNLQILDLADNNLSGAIPKCFKNFTTMANFSNLGCSPLDHMLLVMLLSRKTTVQQNTYFGDKLGPFKQLHIRRDTRRVDQVGNIPSKIGDMRWLESLVFLRNKLIGQISPSMSKLTFLSNLNLSYNYLTRQIPESTQLQSIDRSSFFGNKLCGHPQEKCSIKHVGSPVSLGNQREGIACLLEDGWFDLSLGLGFAFGFWSVLATLLLNMPWSTGFSRFQNNIVSKLYAIIQEKTISIRT